MSDRDAILARLRGARRTAPAPVALSDDGAWSTYADPWAELGRVLGSVGGRLIEVDAAGITAAIDDLTRHLDARRVHVELLGGPSSSDAAAIDAHSAADLDLLVLGGELGVAENAAVWVVPRSPFQRAGLFLAEHVALVVERRAIVHNMHEAYRRIDVAANGFGVFVSGPSKTADIEQALVIGAHGPRSLTVLVVGSEK